MFVLVCVICSLASRVGLYFGFYRAAFECT